MSGEAAPTPSVMRSIVELATRAPSVHNTQPWRWLAHADVLELHADRSRQLVVSDPDRRNLVISCGAALHHAQVAAEARGWAAHVQRLPDALRPDLLARLVLSRTTPSPDAGALLDAIAKRCTDRRRFTSWPVPDERLADLAARACARGARALPLTDVSERFRAELLINRAAELQRANDLTVREQARWVDRALHEGIPAAVLPQARELEPSAGSRFATELGADTDRDIDGADGLILMHGVEDAPATWLRTGEGLSALWLSATTQGLSVVPLSQVIEVPSTRDALQLEVLGGLARPLLVVRVGWQAIGRSELPTTPRRPVDEVLELT